MPRISQNCKPTSNGSLSEHLQKIIDNTKTIIAPFRDITPPPNAPPEVVVNTLPQSVDPRRQIKANIKFYSGIQHDTPLRKRTLEFLGFEDEDYPLDYCKEVVKDLNIQLSEHQVNSLGITHPSPSTFSVGVNMTRFSDVEDEEVTWLWHQRIPMNKFSLIQGDPEGGKTWLALDIAARISAGLDFPDSPNPFADGSNDPSREVIWISAEDDAADTIKPHLRLQKANTNNIFNLEGISDGKNLFTLDLGAHLDWLEQKIREHPLVKLVCFDPISAFLGRVDSHRNSEVRNLLTPFTQLAARLKVTFLGINHLNKGKDTNSMNRGMGSIAFNAAARSVLQVTRVPGDEHLRLVTSVKNNLSDMPVEGLAFRCKHPNGIEWENGEVTTTADEALSPQHKPKISVKETVKGWLIATLQKKSPISANEIWTLSKEAGFSKRTVDTASTELGITKTAPQGSVRQWMWSLPPCND